MYKKRKIIQVVLIIMINTMMMSRNINMHSLLGHLKVQIVLKPRSLLCHLCTTSLGLVLNKSLHKVTKQLIVSPLDNEYSIVKSNIYTINIDVLLKLLLRKSSGTPNECNSCFTLIMNVLYLSESVKYMCVTGQILKSCILIIKDFAIKTEWKNGTQMIIMYYRRFFQCTKFHFLLTLKNNRVNIGVKMMCPVQNLTVKTTWPLKGQRSSAKHKHPVYWGQQEVNSLFPCKKWIFESEKQFIHKKEYHFSKNNALIHVMNKSKGKPLENKVDINTFNFCSTLDMIMGMIMIIYIHVLAHTKPPTELKWLIK